MSFRRNIFASTIYFLLHSAYADISGNWDYVGQVVPGDKDVYTNIVIDKNNVPYVVYTDSHYSYRPSVITYHPDKGWQYFGKPGFSHSQNDRAFSVSTPAIALDNHQVPYVLFHDDGFLLSVVKYTPQGWQYVGQPDFAKAALDAHTTPIAVDSKGVPYIVFVDEQQGMTVLKYEENQWTKVGNPDIHHAGSPSIALDSQGTPYVAYEDTTHAYKAAVIRYTPDDGWLSLGSDSLTEIPNKDQVAIAIDKNNIKYIAYTAYQNHSNSVAGIVKKYNMGKWVELGKLPVYPYDIHLAIDNHNQPCISFSDYNYNGVEKKVSVMKYIPEQGWIFMGKRNFSEGSMEGLSFVLDSNDTPYVAFGMYHYLGAALQGTAIMKFKTTKIAAE